MSAMRQNVKVPISDNTHLLREVIDKMEYMVRVMDADRNVVYMNRKMKQEFGNGVGHVCYKLLGTEGWCSHCVISGSKATGESDTKDVCLGDKHYKVMSSPVSIERNKDNYFIEIFEDITDQKKMETELMDHYEKLKSDIEFAKHIQIRSLPEEGDYGAAMRIDNVYLPSSDLSGDYYDIIKMDEDKFLLYIADVSGHGVRSSLITIFLRQLIRGRIPSGDADIQGILNHVLRSYNDLAIGEEHFLSVLICSYDKRSQELTIANAGHNCLPLLIRSSGKLEEIPVKGMPICCLIQESDHEEVRVQLEKGDRLLLYTDGITEAFNEKINKQFGFEGLKAVVDENLDCRGKELLTKITSAVQTYVNKPPADDIAILSMEIL